MILTLPFWPMDKAAIVSGFVTVPHSSKCSSVTKHFLLMQFVDLLVTIAKIQTRLQRRTMSNNNDMHLYILIHEQLFGYRPSKIQETPNLKLQHFTSSELSHYCRQYCDSNRSAPVGIHTGALLDMSKMFRHAGRAHSCLVLGQKKRFCSVICPF